MSLQESVEHCQRGETLRLGEGEMTSTVVCPEHDSLSSLMQRMKDGDLIQLEHFDICKEDPSFLFSCLHLLGTRYNSLVQNWQSFKESMEAENESLLRRNRELFAERKKIFNELIELKGNIRVFCRCRPMSSEELSKGNSMVVEFDPSQQTELHIISSDSSRKHFQFDHVFGPRATQEDVFQEVKPMVKSVLDGFNACIFAYGQTGTGKTFTMEGTPDCRGVNYRTLEELFSISEGRSSIVRYEFFVSMLEVYNERIRDLLTDNSDPQPKKLEVKQAAEGTQEIPGLAEAPAHSTDEILDLLKTGAKNRSVGSTAANELSSRSHSLVRLTVKAENLMDGTRTRSHLWLVDLAGSERVNKINVEGDRLKESLCINKSLSALGDVIAALASKNGHIPYRNSKLTHLLQSSLGGDCKTLMIVQISPCSGDVGETLSSLNFASRVRGIEQGPARKQPDAAESFRLKDMMEKLRVEEKERARLKDNLELLQIKFGSRESIYLAKIKELENQLADERGKGKREKVHVTKPPHPLSATLQRPPLASISNNLLAVRGAKAGEKENLSTDPPMRARRVLLTPVIRSKMPASDQPRRRASVAVASWAAMPPPVRRSSVALPMDKMNNAARRSHLEGPTPQAQWAKHGLLRIPELGASPSRGKLCYSIQKRLVVGSPGVTFGRRGILPRARPTETESQLGGARRIPVLDKRRSVI